MSHSMKKYISIALTMMMLVALLPGMLAEEGEDFYTENSDVNLNIETDLPDDFAETLPEEPEVQPETESPPDGQPESQEPDAQEPESQSEPQPPAQDDQPTAEPSDIAPTPEPVQAPIEYSLDIYYRDIIGIETKALDYINMKLGESYTFFAVLTPNTPDFINDTSWTICDPFLFTGMLPGKLTADTSKS
ncbi:hypothetical protein FACS1894184_13910 [Clostridia bacterium]|nr:hypothetical protein FACS1894184_13910 [Clostridia bacterium]